MTTTGQNVAPSGMVRLWDIEKKKWIDAFTVDAKELLRVGAASLTAPDVHMAGPAGKVVVCESEIAAYETRGYKVVDDEGDGKKDDEGDGKKDDDKKENGGGGGGEPYAFDRHTVTELRAFAQRAGVEGADKMNKAALVEALAASGWKPQ